MNDQESNDQQKPNDQGPKKAFDLAERTAVFAERVIDLLKRVPINRITGPIVSQLVRSATSIGANYCEADEALTKKEFRHRIGISKREAKESCFHLRMLVAAVPECRDDARLLWQECKELVRIFAAIAGRRMS
jgi:four helix bundle protein